MCMCMAAVVDLLCVASGGMERVGGWNWIVVGHVCMIMDELRAPPVPVFECDDGGM